MSEQDKPYEEKKMGNIRRWISFVSLAIILAFYIFLIGEMAGIVRLLYMVNQTLGRIAAFLAVAIGLGVIVIPGYIFLRLPKPLIPPKEDTGPDHERHLNRIRDRLAVNPLLKTRTLTARADLEEAIGTLNAEAEKITIQWAKRVFLGTALSQNGVLDMLVVLGAHITMIRRIAGVYYQRPTPRDLLFLYSNVAGTAFLSYTLEEIDLSEQVQPIIESAIGGVTAVPILGTMVTPLVSAIMDGTANAFLTLRVGIIASRYCVPLTHLKKKTTRRVASARAAKLLGGIVIQGTQDICRVVTKAAGKKFASAGSSLAEKTKKGLYTLWPFSSKAEEETECK
jgi:hypothetical protein